MGNDAIISVATLDAGYDYNYDDYLETRGWVYLLGGRPGVGTELGSFISWAGLGRYSLNVILWDIESHKLMWSITTNSNSTGSESEDIKALGEFVSSLLLEKGLVEAAVDE